MILATVGLILSMGPAYAGAGIDVYFVRHAETLGNVTHRHTAENDRTFSANGERQVAQLTRKLDQMRFDHIVVSPKYRALNTIFPYLKKHGLKAEVWPELEECCWQKPHSLSGGMPVRSGSIRLEAAMQPYFIFPDAESRYHYASNSYGQGMMQIFMATDKLKKRFSGTGKTILVVGHYHLGSRFIEILQGVEPAGHIKLSNAKISHLKEQADGSFALISLNR